MTRVLESSAPSARLAPCPASCGPQPRNRVLGPFLADCARAGATVTAKRKAGEGPPAPKRKRNRATERRNKATRKRIAGLYYPVGIDAEEFYRRIGDLRREAEIAIDRLIAFIDALDETTPEPDADLEPNLGSQAAYSEHADQRDWATPDADEREGLVDDDEPSLGWTVSGAAGSSSDLEDEHDGREPDVCDEPLLGATAAFNQIEGWRLPEKQDGSWYEPEADELDAGEHDPAESGIADAEGMLEQLGGSGRGNGAVGFASHIE